MEVGRSQHIGREQDMAGHRDRTAGFVEVGRPQQGWGRPLQDEVAAAGLRADMLGQVDEKHSRVTHQQSAPSGKVRIRKEAFDMRRDLLHVVEIVLRILEVYVAESWLWEDMANAVPYCFWRHWQWRREAEMGWRVAVTMPVPCLRQERGTYR